MDRRFGARGHERLAPLMGAISDIAAAYQTTRAQVALAWVLHHPNTVAIPRARTLAQIEENLAATKLSLEEDEFARLTVEALAWQAGLWP